MATFMSAIECLRERGQVQASGAVSARTLMQHFHPDPAGSVRALQAAIFASVATRRPWAVILCRFKGMGPNPVLERPIEDFFRHAFSPGSGGLVEYWRDVSLGSIDITGSRVFDWVETDIERSKAAGTPRSTPAGPGRSGLIDYAIKALQKRGDDPLAGFHSQIVIYPYRWAKDGAPAGADYRTPGWGSYWIDGSADGRGKVCLTPPFDGNVVAHEMGHGFNMEHDVGADMKTNYADPCCIMSQNGSFQHPIFKVPFGPALCIAHLAQQGWLYKRRVLVDAGDWMRRKEGIALLLGAISRPAVETNLGAKLAYKTPDAAWDYYLEYVRPIDWNQGVVPGTAYLFVRRLAEVEGIGVTAIYLGGVAIPDKIGQPAIFTEPSGNVRFTVELMDLPGSQIKVVAQKL